MRLFLDTSVLLAASGSTNGASHEVFRRALAHQWILIATPYVIEEVLRNLPRLPASAITAWARLRPGLLLRDDVLTMDRPVVFGPAKDRPILFSALAWADVLLTLDRGDFGPLMDKAFYGLSITRPGTFLAREDAAGRLRRSQAHPT